MKIMALDDDGASRGWPLVKHPSPEFLIVVVAAEDVQATGYTLIGSELLKQSLTIALAAAGGNESL